jgi:hypothetical protein
VGELKYAIFVSIVIVFLLIFAPNLARAQDTANAQKSGGVSSCETTTTGPFTILPGNTRIRWSAERFDSPPCPTGSGAGDDFWLDRMDGGTLQDVPLSQSLANFDGGELDLPPGDYQIAINLGTMGSGRYTILYNLRTAIALTPSTDAFSTLEDSVSSARSFSVASTGDLDVEIVSIEITGAEAGHFELVGLNPTGNPVPASFQVRCTGDNAPGNKSATLTVTARSNGGEASDSATLTCDVEALEPDIFCRAVTDFGDADQTIPEIITRNIVIENRGNAPLSIAAPTFGAPTAPEFSFVGLPVATTIAPSNSLDVPISFDPTGAAQDAVFAGVLSVSSDDPDDSPKACGFTARAHQPRPIMVVDPAGDLDFRDVEIGFAFTKPIVVSNLGDAPLVFSVSDAPALGDSPDQWSVRETGARVIAPGGQAEFFRQVCEPDAEGSYTMTMEVAGNDSSNPSQMITMTCNGIPPIPIDAVLVLDRSGSMDQRLGGDTAARKIEAMRSAAQLFGDLLNFRAESVSDVDADQIGLVRYNQTSDVYLPLAPAKDSHYDTLIDTSLAEVAVLDPAQLLPAGETGIGGAMNTAASMLVGSPTTRKHVMVLLTDGIENRSPSIADVQASIFSADPDLDAYAIGLGSDAAIDADKLQSISNAGADGFHQVDDDLTGLGRFRLEEFYFKIFSDAADLELAVDPSYHIDLSMPDPVIVDTAIITTSDKSAYFLSLDAPEYRPFYDLELVSPRGEVLMVGAEIGGVPVQIKARNSYRVFRVVFPELALSGSYVGTWKLRLRPNGKCPPRPIEDIDEKQVRKPENPCQTYASAKAPFGFAAAVASNYKLAVAAIPDSAERGGEILLTARLSDRGWPAVVGEVSVDVKDPSGLEYARLPMFDDGTHGDVSADDGVWTRRFVDTDRAGSYRFHFKALGKNERGELAPREAMRYVTLKNPIPSTGTCGEDCTEPCLSCAFTKWLWAIVIGFLLLLLFCCYRKGFAMKA